MRGGNEAGARERGEKERRRGLTREQWMGKRGREGEERTRQEKKTNMIFLPSLTSSSRVPLT